ncbi:MAG: hypothetical protein DBW62_01705 [Microbacterium sp.]|nr:MAG: hypothetical protein DBW62_01705 [Microbacterium sp.]
MFTWLRQRLGAAIDWRVDDRVGAVRNRVGQLAEDVAGLRREMDSLRGHVITDYGYMRAEFDRIAPQVAALEYRLDRVSQTLGDVPEDDRSRAELEHERARLRMELVSHYEERLRRLERVRGGDMIAAPEEPPA